MAKLGRAIHESSARASLASIDARHEVRPDDGLNDMPAGGTVPRHVIGFSAKVVSHGRYMTFQMAEVAVSRQMLRIS